MNSPILDLGIVLIFTYLLLSIIASTIYEAFLTLLKARGKMLKHAFKTLFFDEEWKKVTSKYLIDSPTIKALKKTEKSFPAYVSAQNFAGAIIGMIRNGSTEPVTVEYIRKRLTSDDSIIKGDARVALLNILDSAQNDYDKFLKGLERFYDDYMDRVSGWFKLKYQKIMLVISLVITLVLNVDTMRIATTLWKDKAKLSAVADVASTEFGRMQMSDDKQTIVYKRPDGSHITLNVVHHFDSTTIPADSAIKLVKLEKQNVDTLVKALMDTGIPMGWQSKQDIYNVFKWEPALAVRIFGWLVTALAVYMGAPTWFDILNKLVNLRGAGKKPKEAEKS